MATIPDKRQADGTETREKIDGYLTRSGLASRSPRVVPLTGDASDRRYFRVLLPDSGSIVLSLHAAPFEFEKLPFVNVARLLAAMPVPIPTVLGHADDLGVLALADRGDVTLQAHLGAASATDHAALYRQAVALIATLQRRGAELASPEYLPYGIAFDVEKLTWELDFFIKHFIEAYRGVVIGTSVKEELRREFAVAIEGLAAEPRVLCHRDYHSRNLMLHSDDLYIIDFQDARMGPDTYDLVSLLRDSYVDIDDAALDGLMEHYLSLAGRRDAGEFRRRFDLMAVQRNLKALGTFGNQAGARGNPAYIQYMPRTLAYTRRNLATYPRFARLRELLAAHVPELA